MKIRLTSSGVLQMTEGLVQFPVNENGFNGDRVIKAIEKIKAAKNKASHHRAD
ncbi:hypothetical protein QQ045_003158 [Rhodiola kirilowii]